MNITTISSIWNTKTAQFFALFFSALILGVFHFGNDMLQWSLQRVSSGNFLMYTQLGLMILHTVVSISFLLLLVIRNKFIAYGIFPLFLFIWIVPAYLRITVGHSLYSELITAALGTNWHELSSQLTIVHLILLIVIIASGIVSAYFLRRFFTQLKKLSSKWVWSTSIFYLSCSIAVVPTLAEFAPKWLIPFLCPPLHGSQEDKEWQIENYLTHFENEYKPEYPYRVLMPFYRQFGLFYHIYDYYQTDDMIKAETLTSHLTNSEDLIVVFFIGESYRSDHASWNGYYRETLPQLSTIKNNIINFPFFKSFATTTASSIYGMLTDATTQNRKATHTSFLNITKKHGFTNQLILCRTTQWQHNPQINKALDASLASITTCIDTPDIISKIKETTSIQGKHFIVIEDGTGHAGYDHEPQFSQFGNEGIDRFNNSLLQVDDLLFRISETLKGKNAVILYSSDHGESFGEQGCHMHGGSLNIIKQRHVFSFVWYSDIYASKHQDIIHNIRNNANKLLSHDDIYRSILSMSDIECHIPTPNCYDFTKPLDRPDVTAFSINEK